MIVDDFEPVLTFLILETIFWKQYEIVPISSKYIVQAMVFDDFDDFEPVLSFLHFLKHNEIAPISSKYIVWAIVLHGFEPVL